MKQTKQTKQVKKEVSKRQTNSIKKEQVLRKDNSMKYLCLFIVVIAFVFAFVALINKQQNGSYMNDLKENNLNVTPQVGKIIVARDMDAIYPKYYVVYTEDDGTYSIYTYHYYETTSQYELEYNRLISDIVDYNAKEKMIRCIFSRGYGTYNEVLNNLAQLVESDNLRIY